jgi:hypothetical protein
MQRSRGKMQKCQIARQVHLTWPLDCSTSPPPRRWCSLPLQVLPPPGSPRGSALRITFFRPIAKHALPPLHHCHCCPTAHLCDCTQVVAARVTAPPRCPSSAAAPRPLLAPPAAVCNALALALPLLHCYGRASHALALRRHTGTTYLFTLASHILYVRHPQAFLGFQGHLPRHPSPSPPPRLGLALGQDAAPPPGSSLTLAQGVRVDDPTATHAHQLGSCKPHNCQELAPAPNLQLLAGLGSNTLL